MADFLLEIGTEEIPDWMIEPALASLHNMFEASFGFFGGSALIKEATPRRLVLIARDLADRAPDSLKTVDGPYVSAGEKAAQGFARKQGVAVSELRKVPGEKGERYVYAQYQEGQVLNDALREHLPEIIPDIHFPKSMYWTGKGGVRFIRPVRWIVAVIDDKIVPFEVAGIQSGNLTRGHRILGSKEPLPVTASNYFDVLKQNFVIVRAEERQARIALSLGPDVHKDDDLLRTLVYLTEYPSTIRGAFDPAYLELPQEILSTVMRHHQRYFSVVKPDGSLAPEFVAVTNTDGDPEGLIRQGNERVLRARFNDARFFWKVDQQKKLVDRVPDLAKVTFQAKLGTYKDKTERIQKLAADLALKLRAERKTVDVASLLCKCDLTTDMVKEFTELQGVVGGLYARAQDEGEDVATAIYDHYRPVNMDDAIPRTLEGQIVSIADKLDTLRASFRVGLIPTGTKDPFALRRAAQGVVKILFEARLNIPLMQLIEDVPVLVPFMRERIDFYLRDILGFSYDEVAAVMAPPMTTLADLADRAAAIRYIRPTEDFEPLAASFKRIKNILKQAGIDFATHPVQDLLAPGPEKELHDSWQRVMTQMFESTDYREKLTAIASLRPQVDLFFDKILVNDPNPAIRENRLALLSSLLTEFSTIADFSEIVTKG